MILITNNNNNTQHYYTSDHGWWMVGPDYNKASGWLMSSLGGLSNIPTAGWKYDAGPGPWVDDNTLHVSY